MDLELTPDEQKIAKRLEREATITGWVIALVTGAVLLAFGILGYQSIRWLKTAEWPSLTWADAFAGLGPLDVPNGRGFEKILRWLGGLPLWLLPLVFAFGLTQLWFKSLNDTGETRRVRQKIAQRRYGSGARR